ncbi:MAG: hypothetical protein AAGK09_02555 [Planctomycetota bacterium]
MPTSHPFCRLSALAIAAAALLVLGAPLLGKANRDNPKGQYKVRGGGTFILQQDGIGRQTSEPTFKGEGKLTGSVLKFEGTFTGGGSGIDNVKHVCKIKHKSDPGAKESKTKIPGSIVMRSVNGGFKIAHRTKNAKQTWQRNRRGRWIGESMAALEATFDTGSRKYKVKLRFTSS